MAISGSLDEASLADVLQLLSLGRKTGRLSVSDQSNLGHIYLDSGKITHAYIVSRYHRLGDILFKNGHITRGQLAEAIRLQSDNPQKKVGEILVEIGATSRSELSHYMQVQIEEAVYFLFTWRRGDFAFERDIHPDPDDFLVSINTEALLLEGARRVDEWSVIEKKIPSFNMVFRVDHERLESSHAVLSSRQQRIAALLNGERDVAAIVTETGMIEFDVGQALYGLITAGFAVAVGPNAPQSPSGTSGHDGTGHLDREKLVAYLTHQAEFADEQRRRQSGMHIADCPTCSRRLQEIHVRRSQGLPAIPEPPVERRLEYDRRQLDASPPVITKGVARRVHGAGDRRRSTRMAAVLGRTSEEPNRRTEPDKTVEDSDECP